MFKLGSWVNSVEQMTFSGYHDRNDALRKANELWGQRDQMFRLLGIPVVSGRLELEVVSDSGASWDHRQILAEIETRPELQEAPKVY